MHALRVTLVIGARPCGFTFDVMIDWSEAPIRSLVGHIVDVHHGYTRSALQRIEVLARKVRMTHGCGHRELDEVDESCWALGRHLLPHMQAEESVVFPLLEAIVLARTRSERPPRLSIDARDMNEDHAEAARRFRRLREVTDGFRVPDDASARYRELYDTLQALERDLHEHMRLESRVLLPRAIAAVRE